MIVTMTEAEVEGLLAYAQWYGAAHEEDCSGDDTCDCTCKPMNDAINALCRKVLEANVKEISDGKAR